MITIATKINDNKLMISTTPCRRCSATIEFGCFTTVTCPKCHSYVPNYTQLVKNLELRVEYYKYGKINGISIY